MKLREVLEPARLQSHVARIGDATSDQVDRILEKSSFQFDDYLLLLSEAAGQRLEALAARAQTLTQERFGRIIQLYAPVYVSNECTNACVYCGFSRKNEIRRVTLTLEEAEREAELLWNEGFRNLLLVSGEAPRSVPISYFEALATRLRRRFPALAIEIYPLEESGYRRLVEAGIDGLTVYQETYDPELYQTVHPQGPKSDFEWRLDAPDRGAAAGMRRIGIAPLLGLGPWQYESAAVALHALWLQQEHWQTQVSVSFPRLRAASGNFAPPHPVSDRKLVQLACALRLLLPDAGLILSTREAPAFRDGLARICITQMSAGSRTEPGGYSRPREATSQFAVEDARSADEVAHTLLSLGIEPVWKDWDEVLVTPLDEEPPRVTMETPS